MQLLSYNQKVLRFRKMLEKSFIQIVQFSKDGISNCCSMTVLQDLWMFVRCCLKRNVANERSGFIYGSLAMYGIITNMYTESIGNL